MVRSKRSKLYGFTLVELLIVVAIIGVLATIGIPTFRTMVQKSKKSEAKIALGGLYTSETAFFSEYGAYGDNLNAIGFDLEGSQNNRIYSVGFQTTSCSATHNGTGFNPQTASQLAAIDAAFPNYYVSGTSAFTNTRDGISTNCIAGTVADDGSDFTASANGHVAPGSAPPVDQWTIDRYRALKNVADGVQN